MILIDIHDAIEKDKSEGISCLEGREGCNEEKCECKMIPGSFENVLVQCSLGCYKRYHADGFDGINEYCWSKVIQSYNDDYNCELTNGSKCNTKNCQGVIISIDTYIGFKKKTDNDMDNDTDNPDTPLSDNNDNVSNTKKGPPSGFDIFCKELFSKDENKDLRPRVVDAKWKALSRKKRSHYIDRANIAQLQWIRDQQAQDAEMKAAKDFINGSNNNNNSNDTISSIEVDNNTANKASINNNESDKKELSQKQQKMEQRMREIEEMISRDPNIYSSNEIKRRKNEDKKKKKSRKNKSDKNKSKNKKNKNTTMNLSDLNEYANNYMNTNSSKKYDTKINDDNLSSASNSCTQNFSTDMHDSLSYQYSIPEDTESILSNNTSIVNNNSNNYNHINNNTSNNNTNNGNNNNNNNSNNNSYNNNYNTNNQYNNNSNTNYGNNNNYNHNNLINNNLTNVNLSNHNNYNYSNNTNNNNIGNSVVDSRSRYETLQQIINSNNNVAKCTYIPFTQNVTLYLIVSCNIIQKVWNDHFNNFKTDLTRLNVFVRFFQILNDHNEKYIVVQCLNNESSKMIHDYIKDKTKLNIYFVENWFGYSFTFIKNCFADTKQQKSSETPSTPSIAKSLSNTLRNNNNTKNHDNSIVNRKSSMHDKRPWNMFKQYSLPDNGNFDDNMICPMINNENYEIGDIVYYDNYFGIITNIFNNINYEYEIMLKCNIREIVSSNFIQIGLPIQNLINNNNINSNKIEKILKQLDSFQIGFLVRLLG